MSVEVVMPQMGESITEGTISKWLKQVGDTIERDEPLLEISTDKVDAEVPAPDGGVILEIRYPEGETVAVDSIIAVIGAAGETPSENSNTTAEDSASAELAPTEIEATVDKITENPKDEPAPNSTNAGASTEIVMPQMGESITEGTISKWLKNVGDDVERDEPLLEISTDKVDAEVPSPVAGKLLEIRVQEGETVEVDAVVGIIGEEGAVSPQPRASQSNTEMVSAQPVSTPPSVSSFVAPTTSEKTADLSADELRRAKSSPLVRNIAKEHNIDIATISGTGEGGRVTKKDILSYIESGAAAKPEELMTNQPATPANASTSAQGMQAATPAQSIQRVEFQAPQINMGGGDRIEPMSSMRKKIAEHMVYSKHTSAHVTSVYEIDMTNVARFRDTNKAIFEERYGTKLTFMPFIFQAITNALRKYPVLNSQVSGDQIVYKRDVNLGMAVALDWGLIVPVIKRADLLSLAGLAQTANDLADRARNKKLLPDDVAGGTFTITNPGVFGGLYGTPIINQPQVAILCVGTIEKRPKVVTNSDGDDMIAIRQMAYFALTYDHRVVDGADAERFLAFVKNYLQTTEFSL